MNEIDVYKSLTPKALALNESMTLESFLDPAHIIESLSNKGVTPEWILDHLIEIVDNSDKDTTRMTAIREIRKIINEIAERAGLTAKVTQSQTMADGSVLTAERVANVLAGNTSRSAHAIPSHVIGTEEPEALEDIDNVDNPIGLEGEQDDRTKEQGTQDSACNEQEDGQIHLPQAEGGRDPQGRNQTSASNNDGAAGGGSDGERDHREPTDPAPGVDRVREGCRDSGEPREPGPKENNLADKYSGIISNPTIHPNTNSATKPVNQGDTSCGGLQDDSIPEEELATDGELRTDAEIKAEEDKQLNIHKPPPAGNERLFPGIARPTSPQSGRSTVHKV